MSKEVGEEERGREEEEEEEKELSLFTADGVNEDKEFLFSTEELGPSMRGSDPVSQAGSVIATQTPVSC